MAFIGGAQDITDHGFSSFSGKREGYRDSALSTDNRHGSNLSIFLYAPTEQLNSFAWQQWLNRK